MQLKSQISSKVLGSLLIVICGEKKHSMYIQH